MNPPRFCPYCGSERIKEALLVLFGERVRRLVYRKETRDGYRCEDCGAEFEVRKA